MKSIVVERPGGLEALRLVEGPEPEPGPGEIRVAVRACGVNYADLIVRQGHYEAAKGRYPITPGFEFAGAVDALGRAATRFSKGQRVFGYARFGAYASAVVAPERQIFASPPGWSDPECAALPAVFLTAHHALFRVAKVEAGETLLVHSAAGGAGGAILQLARIAGCRTVAVIGAASKAELCRELGCEHVIDRSTQDLWREADRLSPRGYDAIFDANGVSTPRPGFSRLAPGGRLVVYGFAELFPRGAARAALPRLAWNWLRVPRFSPLEMTAGNRAVMGFNVVFLFDRLELADRAMAEVLRWIGEGRVRKTRVTPFPFERAADAHAALASGRTAGKLVLTI